MDLFYCKLFRPIHKTHKNFYFTRISHFPSINPNLRFIHKNKLKVLLLLVVYIFPPKNKLYFYTFIREIIPIFIHSWKKRTQNSKNTHKFACIEHFFFALLLCRFFMCFERIFIEEFFPTWLAIFIHLDLVLNEKNIWCVKIVVYKFYAFIVGCFEQMDFPNG